MNKTKTLIDLSDFATRTINLNGNGKQMKKVGLNVRFFKRTKDCHVIAKVYETPFKDAESAIKFAENKLKYPNWKLDKGFLKKQLK